ncbi:probable 28S rRNA (cytosine-C(5))-methyltransferase [Varroa jacobsoni]|uniref:SAM-dependent MTase RsmB/NOP-type domain-containing protein n=1 Tax=Varroa destructor TaxID=109461 RepID=A0A7M7JVL8_VARDE|nr:probable 28S rRNA (cytosine-C(5))-methyltransferase [Varroa destructor]XP_022699385.1 probable 28S rRNA (cytosine-C(5))-methyltransferase [Varroa jacobsoni]
MDKGESIVISDSDDAQPTVAPTESGSAAFNVAKETKIGSRKRERLPRVYSAAVKALGARLDKKNQLKDYIFRQDKCRHLSRLKKLICLAYDNYKNLIDTLKLCEFPFSWCDERLAAVIAADVAFSTEMFLPVSKHPKVLAVMKLKAPLQELQKIKVERRSPKGPFRYAILNKLIISREHLDKALKKDGYILSEFKAPKDSTTPEVVLEAYHAHLRTLEIFEYTWDLHFPDDILVFHIKSNLHDKDAFRRKYVLMYDKSIAAPVRTLGANTHDMVLDACSSPGNKATLIAATCRALVCCERNEKRYKVLCQNICTSRANKRCDVQAINVDFLKLNLNDPPFRDCTKAIVDPSCTGGVDFDREVDPARVEKLANLQAACLKKALSLPVVETVVYSTCSSEPRENEGVVKEILEWAKSQPQDKYKGSWALEKALPNLPFRGNEELYPEIGDNCLFFDESRSQTSVQFVAKFVRMVKKKTATAKLKSNPKVRMKLKRLRQKQEKRKREKLAKAQKAKNDAK